MDNNPAYAKDRLKNQAPPPHSSSSNDAKCWVCHKDFNSATAQPTMHSSVDVYCPHCGDAYNSLSSARARFRDKSK